MFPCLQGTQLETSPCMPILSSPQLYKLVILPWWFSLADFFYDVHDGHFYQFLQMPRLNTWLETISGSPHGWVRDHQQCWANWHQACKYKSCIHAWTRAHTHTHVSKITSNFNTVNNLKQLPLYLRNSWLLKIFKPLWICMSPCVLATFVWFEPRSTSLSPTSSLPVQEFQNNTCFQVNSLNSSHNMHAQVHQNAWNVFEQITDTRKLYEFYVRITVKISVGFQ